MREIESNGALVFAVSLFGEDCDLPVLVKLCIVFIHLCRSLHPWSDVHGLDAEMRRLIVRNWRSTFTGNFLSETGAYPVFYFNAMYNERLVMAVLAGALVGLAVSLFMGVQYIKTRSRPIQTKEQQEIRSDQV